jgi:hypothetical protein
MRVLAETAQRLRALRPDHPYAYGVRTEVPAGPGWFPLGGLTAGGPIAEWCTRARHRDNPGGLASVAATAVGGALTRAVLGPVSAALLLERRAWDVRACDLAVHRTPDGDLDEIALRSPVALVLPDDPAAGEPGTTVVADAEALLDRVALSAVAALTPVFEAVRDATRYGLVPLWNGAADAVRSAAVFVPLYAGTDPCAARHLGAALVDALVAHGAGVRTRGPDRPFRHREREYTIPVRAACCLSYKTGPQAGRTDDDYCTTCPFLEAGDRERRFGSFLDTLAPAGVSAARRAP